MGKFIAPDMDNTTRFSNLVDEERERGLAEYKTHNQLPPVPEHTRYLFAIAVEILLTCTVCLFGVMANIVNIVLFYRQGPMSSSPILILTGLAVSDLFVCFFGLMSVVFKILQWFVGKVVMGWRVQHLYIVIANRPLLLMIQVTCWTTTLLTLERAVSVAFPFKVKAIFTPRRSLSLLVVIFVLTFVLYIPSLTVYTSVWIKDAVHAERFRVLVASKIFSPSVHYAYYMLNDIILRYSYVFLVALCNVIIFWKVKSSQRFRQSKGNTKDIGVASETREDSHTHSGAKETTTSKGNNPHPSSSTKDIKDRKLLRMITVVAGVFLFCHFFVTIQTIMLRFVLEVHKDFHATLGNMFNAALRVLEYFNSCINAVIYFNMSARYKEEFMMLWGKKTG